MGLDPAQYQASGWLGAAKETGMDYSGYEPFMGHFERAVRNQAARW